MARSKRGFVFAAAGVALRFHERRTPTTVGTERRTADHCVAVLGLEKIFVDQHVERLLVAERVSHDAGKRRGVPLDELKRRSETLRLEALAIDALVVRDGGTLDVAAEEIGVCARA